MKIARLFCFIALVFLAGAFARPAVSHSQITLTVTVCNASSTCSSVPSPSPTPPSGGGSVPGGGGGGGGGSPPSTPSIPTTVTFSGYAYPNAMVTLLKDGQAVATQPAGPDAKFTMTVYGLTGGTYTFSVIAKDSTGRKSVAYSFTEAVTAGVGTSISGIFLPPTIGTDKVQVKHGDPITVMGQSAPNSTVNLSIHSDTVINKTLTPDASGVWKYVVNSFALEMGSHSAQSFAVQGDQASSYSPIAQFTVGNQNILAPAPTDASSTAATACGALKGDLNCDGRVNLVDFSILSYWYRRALTPAAKLKVDLNHDGKVDLIDFSILAYNWTG